MTDEKRRTEPHINATEGTKIICDLRNGRWAHIEIRDDTIVINGSHPLSLSLPAGQFGTEKTTTIFVGRK